MAYDYINTTGTVVPDTANLREEVVTEWRAALGNNLATSPDTPQGVLITAETLAREGVVNNNAQLANQINPNLAEGVFLDAICALMGIERRVATRSTIAVVNLYGAAQTNVPAGSRATSTTGEVWTLARNAQIGSGGVGVGEFVCTVPGSVLCPIGGLNQVVDMVLGWESVANPVAAVPGQLGETDVELAARREVTLGRQGISTREAQVSGLYDIDGVSSVAFRENVTNAQQTIDGVVMVPHSIWACVDGGDQLAIAESLLKNKTDGAGYNGGTTQPVTDPWSGQIYQVKFDRPAYIDISVLVTVRQLRELVSAVDVIPQSIADWALGRIPRDSGLQIGTDCTAFEVAGAVNYFNPGFQVTDVKFTVASAPVTGTTVPVSIKQRGRILASWVTVVIVP